MMTRQISYEDGLKLDRANEMRHDAEIRELLHKRRDGHTLPQAFYTDIGLFEFDLRAVFHRLWIFAGHVQPYLVISSCMGGGLARLCASAGIARSCRVRGTLSECRNLSTSAASWLKPWLSSAAPV